MGNQIRSGKDKSFYRQLLPVCLVMLAAVLIALFFSLSALKVASDEAKSNLATILELEIQNMQESNNGLSWDTDRIFQLAEDPSMQALSQEGASADGEAWQQAGELLLSLRAEQGGRKSDYYFYFQDSGLLLDSGHTEQNAMEEAPSFLLLQIPELAEESAGYFRKSLGETEDGENYGIYLLKIASSVYYIRVDWGKPLYNLPDTFLKGVSGAEMYSYDRYGNEHALCDSRELSHVYQYDSLGEEPSGTFFFHYGTHSYIGAYCTFQSRDTRVAIFIRDTATESRQMITSLLIVGAFCVIFFGLGFVILYMRRSYQPVNRLLTRLHDDLPEGQEKSRSDFDIINDALDRRDIRFRQQEQLLQDSWLHSLLHESYVDRFDGYQDCWPDEQEDQFFQVIVVRQEASDGQVCPTEPDLIGRMHSLLEEREETFRQITDGYDTVFLLQVNPGKTEELVQVFCRLLEKEFPSSGIIICISGTHIALQELHLCYDEAMMVADYCKTAKISDTVLAYDMTMDQIRDVKLSLPNHTLLKLLEDYIAALSVEDALRQYDSMIYQFTAGGCSPLKQTDMRFELLCKAITLGLYEVSLPGDFVGDGIRRHTNRIAQAHTAEQLRDYLSDSLQSLHTLCCSKMDTPDRFEQMKRYVLEHYKDINFSADAVASQFHLSQSSITRMFNKYNQTGFLEYVHCLRVQEATRLLQETSLTEAVIASMVGYNSITTMGRAFKKYASTTPSRIRSMNQTI